MGVLASVAGCGGGTEGAPIAESSTSSVVATPVADEPWDPCTIPDSAVEAAGLDVGSKESGARGITEIANWKVCSWNNPEPNSWYLLGIFSSLTSSIEDVRQNERFQRFTKDPALGGERFLRSGQDGSESCGLAYEVDGGVVYFVLDKRVVRDALGDPCSEVGRTAMALRSSMPPVVG
ncbi:DUF3558 domain-containing protein [Rhodococcus sp. 05-2254-6]|uniref:DUF3558 domain-containing protein n=1 Tax=Rhodococcus sp. 05-2254-6 TaxID=2022489 RepID=UPI0035940464